ncbi:MAG: PhoU domain-containing protein [Promethearchaeota archaeon]
MEIRRVQKTGGSSYVITLPKEWINQLNIKQKDKIAIISQPDGKLLISPDPDHEKTKRENHINIEDNTNPEYLYRMLLASYITGFSVIKIITNGKFISLIRNSISNFIKSVVGFEIIEETLNTIIIKDLLNPTEMPFDKSIKRMGIILGLMYEDIINALFNKDIELLDDVINRDLEVNRRYRLIARQSNLILHDVILANKMGVSLENAHYYFLISKQLEKIGDLAKEIATNMKKLLENPIDDAIKNKIKNATEFAVDTLNNTLIAWEKRDLKLANELIDNRTKLKQKTSEIKFYRNYIPEVLISLGYIVESIEKMGEHSANIGEIIFSSIISERQQ